MSCVDHVISSINSLYLHIRIPVCIIILINTLDKSNVVLWKVGLVCPQNMHCRFCRNYTVSQTRTWVSQTDRASAVHTITLRASMEGEYETKLSNGTTQGHSMVTQGHWKWYHWKATEKVMSCVDQGTVSYSSSSNYGRIFSHFGDIQRQRMAWPWNLGLGSFKVIENGAVRQTTCDFLLVCHCNYSSILYRCELFDVE